MPPDDITARILSVLPRDLAIDLLDMMVTRARKAHELIYDNTDLAGPTARVLEGLARFGLLEKGFADTCKLHGGIPLDGDVLPDTNLRVHQPFMRFGGQSLGVILGIASMPAPRELPAKNRSRRAGVTLNYRLTPRLDFGGGGTAHPGDTFVLFLFARDRSQGGRLAEIAIGVIDAEYHGYLMYLPIEGLMERYAPPPPETPPPPDDKPVVRLRKNHKRFKPPEEPDSNDAADVPPE